MNKSFSDNEQTLIRKAIELNYAGLIPFSIEMSEDAYYSVNYAPQSTDEFFIVNKADGMPLEGLQAQKFQAILEEIMAGYTPLVLSERELKDVEAAAAFLSLHGSPYEVDNRFAPSSVVLMLDNKTQVSVSWTSIERLPMLTATYDNRSILDSKRRSYNLQLQSIISEYNRKYLKSYLKENRVLELSWNDCKRLQRSGYFCVLVGASGCVTTDGNDQAELVYLVEIFEQTQEQNVPACIIPRSTWDSFRVLKERRL